MSKYEQEHNCGCLLYILLSDFMEVYLRATKLAILYMDYIYRRMQELGDE